MAKSAVSLALPRLARTPRPLGRHAHGLRKLFARRGKLHAHVEHHRDVDPERFFERKHGLGRESMHAAVDVRFERHAVFVELAALLQAEDLEAAGVGEDRAVPRHEAVHAARLDDQLFARAQPQMIGVRQNDLAVRAAHFVRRERLDGRGRADRHEGRRLDHAVRERERAAPRGRRQSCEARRSRACTYSGGGSASKRISRSVRG